MKKASLVQITACIGLLVGAGLIIYDNPAFGISYAAISLEEAVGRSEVIVVGRVERLAADRDLSERFNLAYVKVAKVLKNTTKESPIKIGDELSIQVWADGVWGKVPYTKGKEGVLLLKHVPDKTIFEALHPVRFQPLTKEKEIVALIAKEKKPIPPTVRGRVIPRRSIKLKRLVFSPNGTKLVGSFFMHGRTVHGRDWGAWVTQWDVATGKAVTIPNAYGPIAFSADGQTIAMGVYEFNPRSQRGSRGPPNVRLGLWRPGETEPFRVFRREAGQDDSAEAAAFSPDGKRVVSVTRTTEVLEWATDGEEPPELVDYLLPSWPHPRGRGGAPALPSVSYTSRGHYNGCLLVSYPGDFSVLWRRRAAWRAFSRGRPFVRLAVFKNDENTAGTRRTTPLVVHDTHVASFLCRSEKGWSLEVDRTPRVPLAPDWMKEYQTSKVLYSLRLAPDGLSVAVFGRKRKEKQPYVALRRLDSGQEIRVFKTASQPVAFGPAGKLIATGSDLHPVVLWNIETGERVRSFEFPTNLSRPNPPAQQ